MSEQVYIDYQTERFHGIVGPFTSRAEADAWAEDQQQPWAEWEGAGQHYTPDKAAAHLTTADQAAGEVSGE